MVELIQMLCPSSKYGIKCPYAMSPQYITIHNTANDASARNEISYMIGNNYETSYHFAIDDISIVQGLPLDRNGWHSGDGNGPGNRKSIGIEICYSRSGGPRFEAAQRNAAEFTAYLLKQRGWGIDRVKKHQDWSGKHCPHRTLDQYGWQYFLNLVQEYMGGKPQSQSKPTTTPTGKVSVTYQTWDDVLNKWLPNVTDKQDYAGIYGHDVCCVYANLSRGNIRYQVHYKGGSWLPVVTNRSDYAGIYNKPIDAIAISADSEVMYQVHLRHSNKWLPPVSSKKCNINDSENGFAGIIGQEIDAIYIWGV